MLLLRGHRPVQYQMLLLAWASSCTMLDVIVSMGIVMYNVSVSVGIACAIPDVSVSVGIILCNMRC